MLLTHRPTAALFAAALLLSLGGMPARAASVLISIDKAAQRMTVAVDGQARHTWKVSTGKAGYSTPSGTYKPFRLERSHRSDEWDNAPMPHSIFFTERGHAIHGSYNLRRLGTAVSHGCVRLAPGNARKLFSLVQKEGLGNITIVVAGNDLALSEELAPLDSEVKNPRRKGKR